jgi:hypothetical protein
MRKSAILIHLFSILTILILVFFFTAIQFETAHAASGKDYVIVIDVSTSMEDRFDDVRDLSKRTIDRTSVGDSVVVITFGEQATLLDRKNIRGKADQETLKNRVNDIYPTDYATYINRGLEKGLAELRYLFEKNPDRERVLLWLSDDKDNPPEELGSDYITLESLKKEDSDFNPGSDWFEYDDPVSEVDKAAAEDFLKWARRETFRVEVTQRDLDLGSFEDGKVSKTITLQFVPKNVGAAGLEFFVSAVLISRSDKSQKIDVSITPDRVRTLGDGWNQKFQISFEAPPGEYSGAISFDPIAKSALEVLPRIVTLRTAIVLPEPEIEEPAEPVEEEPEGLLADEGLIARESRPPGTTRPSQPLLFGPLEPGKEFRRDSTLYVNIEADPDRIAHDLSIKLPEGINFKSEVIGGGTKKVAKITVSVDSDIQLPDQFALDQSFEGSVRFKSDEQGVNVLPVYIPIRLTFVADEVRWGGKMLPQTGVGQAKARQMTFEELTAAMEEGKTEQPPGVTTSTLREFISEAGSGVILWPLLGVIVIIIVLLLYRLRPASEVFVGELVIIKDPTDSNMKNVNLKRVGSLHDKNVLTVGSSPKADIRLNHDSIAPIHCKISAKTGDGSSASTLIHPIKGVPIKVNEIEQTDKAALSDKDLLAVGDFILLYSNPEAQKEIVARFLDGRTMRGTPVTWDIGTPSFELLRTDTSEAEGTTDEITVVDFADIKAIFFLQEGSGAVPGMPAEMVNREEMVEVGFSDGEKMEGFPLKDYTDASGRFYIVPLEMPNIASILIERSSIDKMERRKAPSESESAKSGGLLGSLRKRKGDAAAS